MDQFSGPYFFKTRYYLIRIFRISEKKLLVCDVYDASVEQTWDGAGAA